MTTVYQRAIGVQNAGGTRQNSPVCELDLHACIGTRRRSRTARQRGLQGWHDSLDFSAVRFFHKS
jgi:hypothetical protein